MTVDGGDLFIHYRQISQLIRHKYFGLTEIEDMMPFELGVYVDLINLLKKEEKDAAGNR
jgi:hypothetical protein